MFCIHHVYEVMPVLYLNPSIVSLQELYLWSNEPALLQSLFDLEKIQISDFYVKFNVLSFKSMHSRGNIYN